jgi:hypothetical protein
MTIFRTIRDLEVWVYERSGEDAIEEDNEAIVNEIMDMKKFPSWGEDVTDFLETLPNDLLDLI